MTVGAGRNVVYTAFNMSAEMTQGTTKLCWTYDADHSRVRMDESNSTCGSPTSSTYYLNDPVSGLMSEKIVSGTTTTKDYLSVGGVLIGTRTKVGAAAATISYFVVDHLGSIAVTTDEVGALVCRMTYDPWGKSTATGGSCVAPTRGFTSEESISTGALVNLVNLNARVYDAALGRFLAADPMSNPFEMQTLNLYTYALNSPLAFTDRSGLCASSWSSFDENGEETTGITFCQSGVGGWRLSLPGQTNGVGANTSSGNGPVDLALADHNVFHHALSNSSNAGPAKSRNNVTPKPKYGHRDPSCRATLGLCIKIDTGFGDLPADRARAAQYARGQRNSPVTAELEAILANAPREAAIAMLEAMQSAYDSYIENPSLLNAAQLELAILGIVPTRMAVGKFADVGKLFEKAGINVDSHFLYRLAQRFDRGITETGALDAYRNGRLFYNPATDNYIRHSSRTGISVVTSSPTGGKAITVFEGNPSPTWVPVPWRPGQ